MVKRIKLYYMSQLRIFIMGTLVGPVTLTFDKLNGSLILNDQKVKYCRTFLY